MMSKAELKPRVMPLKRFVLQASSLAHEVELFVGTLTLGHPKDGATAKHMVKSSYATQLMRGFLGTKRLL